ncbi:MAG: hypothetical protein PHS34_08115 [Candidatus Omnitrophica bacterium]|nr:hypothetical protein [Candidatus Omnitrophota bacterium]
MAKDKEEKDLTESTDSDESEEESTDVEDEKKGTYSEEQYKAVVSESITRKKKINDLEKKLKAFEDEKLTETEKKDKKIAEMEKQLVDLQTEQKDKEIDNLILTVANGKNFNDMEIVKMLAKKELDSEEEVTKEAVEKIIDKLAKDKPYLVSSESVVNPSLGNFGKTDKEPAKDINKMFSDVLHGK